MAEFVLSSQDARVVVDAAHGGRLSSLDVFGHQLLVGGPGDPLAWGAYPMVPFAGRLRDGTLTFGGERYVVPTTMGPHAIHGYGFVTPWERIDESSIGFDFADPWPFGGRATQTFDLTDDRLRVEMTVDAADRQPICVGWHPWFRREIGIGAPLELDFDPAVMYAVDDEIPTGRQITPPPGPWDNCFAGLTDNPRLRWGALTVEISSTLDHWVVYDMPEHAVCVEPQSGPPNDLNDAPLIIEAGESFAASMTLRWSR